MGSVMRIVSLLPSATELICGLGLQEHLVGVSHECDYPSTFESLPKLTRSRIPSGLASRDIDIVVSAQLETDHILYDLEVSLLVDLAPDLVVTQALCNVCAVSGNDVVRALDQLPGNPVLVNLEPTNLREVLNSAIQVSEAADCRDSGADYVKWLRNRINSVGDKSREIANQAKPRVALLDWLDPLFDGGHWSPEIIALAGGKPCFGVQGEPSQRRDWSELIAAAPEVIIVALCGFDIARSMQDVRQFVSSKEFLRLKRNTDTRVYLFDGNAYFSRPGPRLVDALEITANALHPNVHGLSDDLMPALEILCEGP